MTRRESGLAPGGRPRFLSDCVAFISRTWLLMGCPLWSYCLGCPRLAVSLCRCCVSFPLKHRLARVFPGLTDTRLAVKPRKAPPRPSDALSAVLSRKRGFDGKDGHCRGFCGDCPPVCQPSHSAQDRRCFSSFKTSPSSLIPTEQSIPRCKSTVLSLRSCASGGEN